jgi:hypothetical protein
MLCVSTKSFLVIFSMFHVNNVWTCLYPWGVCMIYYHRAWRWHSTKQIIYLPLAWRSDKTGKHVLTNNPTPWLLSYIGAAILYPSGWWGWYWRRSGRLLNQLFRPSNQLISWEIWSLYLRLHLWKLLYFQSFLL